MDNTYLLYLEFRKRKKVHKKRPSYKKLKKIHDLFDAKYNYDNNICELCGARGSDECTPQCPEFYWKGNIHDF